MVTFCVAEIKLISDVLLDLVKSRFNPYPHHKIFLPF